MPTHPHLDPTHVLPEERDPPSSRSGSDLLAPAPNSSETWLKIVFRFAGLLSPVPLAQDLAHEARDGSRTEAGVAVHVA